jgi:hypothetical protein
MISVRLERRGPTGRSGDEGRLSVVDLEAPETGGSAGRCPEKGDDRDIAWDIESQRGVGDGRGFPRSPNDIGSKGAPELLLIGAGGKKDARRSSDGGGRTGGPIDGDREAVDRSADVRSAKERAKVPPTIDVLRGTSGFVNASSPGGGGKSPCDTDPREGPGGGAIRLRSVEPDPPEIDPETAGKDAFRVWACHRILAASS